MALRPGSGPSSQRTSSGRAHGEGGEQGGGVGVAGRLWAGQPQVTEDRRLWALPTGAGQLPPGVGEEVVGVGGPGACQLGRGDLAAGQGGDAGQRDALGVGQGKGALLALGAQSDTGKGGAAFAGQGDPAPGEGQAQGGLFFRCSASPPRRRAGRRRAGRVQVANRPCLLALLGGQRDLGVDLLAIAPGRGQALEGGAVFEAELREALVEISRLRGARLPRGARCSSGSGACEGSATRASRRRAGSTAAPSAAAAGVDRDLALAVFVGAGDRDPQRRPPSPAARISGACRVSSSTSVRRAVRGGAEGQLQEGGAGQEHRCRRRRGRPARGGWRGRCAPLRVRPSPSGSSIAAPSSGWSGPRPGRARRRRRAARAGCEPVALALEGVGRQGDALGAAACEEGSPVDRRRRRRGPRRGRGRSARGRPRRGAGCRARAALAGSSSASSIVSWTAKAKTGWGPISMKARCPGSSRERRTPAPRAPSGAGCGTSSRGRARRCRSARRVTVEWKGICGAAGEIGAKASRSSCSSASIWAEWAA